MNIVIVEPLGHHAGHYTQELYSFCSCLAPHVESVHVLTPFGFKEQWNPIDKCTVHKLLFDPNTGTARFTSMHGPLYRPQWQFYKSASMSIRELRPDVVHVWGFKSILPLWRFLRHRNNSPKTVMTLKAVLRNHAPVLGSTMLASLKEKLSYRLLRAFADLYIVHTKQLSEQAKGIGISDANIILIPTGIDKHDPTITKEEARIKLGLPLSKFLLLFFGVLREEKGVFEVLARVNSLPENALLYIVGEDWTQERVESIVQREGLQQKVICNLSYVQERDVEMHFRASDAVIIAPRAEFVGESGVLLRAAEFGIPILAAEHGHTSTVVREENIGAVFNKDDRLSFQAAVQQLMNDLHRSPHFFNAAMSRFRQSREWSQIVAQYLQVYGRG